VTILETADVAGLRVDGRQIHIRDATAADSAALAALSDAVSEHSLYLRFFTLNRVAARRYYASISIEKKLGRLVLVACDIDQVIGVACSEQITAGSAEIALLVHDQYQGLGVGTLLLDQVMARARLEGIESFVAEVLVENYPMLAVLHDLGYHAKRVSYGCETLVACHLEPDRQSHRLPIREPGCPTSAQSPCRTGNLDSAESPTS
jgi:RimJ/RimL family protein N-acetyltransferase